jgi:hypothetical protein
MVIKMEIKKQLKNFDIKISKLASDLNISRPTLDSYIENYEKGITLTNDLYQQIFDHLFSVRSETNIDFARKFDYVKRFFMDKLEKDPKILKSNNREVFLTQNIIGKIEQLECKTEMLEFINLFISNNDLSLVNGIVNYFNIVNGFLDYQSLDSKDNDNALYSHLFDIFRKYLNNELQIDHQNLLLLIEKNKLILEKKESNEADRIIMYIKQNTGNDSKIDYEYLKTLITKEKI